MFLEDTEFLTLARLISQRKNLFSCRYLINRLLKERKLREKKVSYNYLYLIKL